ncbi:MAG TPA: hypothetical protein VGY56_11350 [Verrucomicrobiae bacterium]|nr:hypothetical protein [Verrucomicrobiae bacterium]
MNAPLELPSQDQTSRQGWTAAQLASAGRLSKRWVLRKLAGTPAAGSIIAQGNETAVYNFDVLPSAIQTAIAASAGATGLSVAEYIETSCIPWRPARPLSEIDNAGIEDAKKLRAALLSALQRQTSKLLSSTEKARVGLADYKREIGHEITVRHWQRLIERTLRRAGASEDFERLELYLPDNPKPKMEAQRLTPGESEFADLLAIIRGCADLNHPTDGENAAIWNAAFEIFDESENIKKRKYLRRSLVKFLFRHAPALAGNEHTLHVMFNQKFARWIEGKKTPAALLDGRKEKAGVSTAEPFAKPDLDKIVWHASANCGGRVAQAVRDLRASGERSGLSKDTLEILSRPAGRKSYVNRRLMDQVSNEVQQLMPFFLGKQAIDDITASLRRDYTKLASMAVISADDFTMPVYFYVPDGNGWFTLTRGQCLIFLDARSWRIIGYSLQPERNYNSLVIRTLMNRVCSEFGIPGTWYFERGIWKRSLLVNGRVPTGWSDALSPTDVKTGWETFGVKFVYAKRARTKPIERVGGLLQDLMHGVRGYCGRDERRDCPEQTKRAMDDVQARRVEHPGELFFSFQEWDEQLATLIEKYNATSQDGDVLQGLTPDDAFQHFWPESDPPTKLDERAWHLLAHYVRPIHVTSNGICFRVGQKKFVYRNERTGQDRGKEVLVWFDPESPDFVSVTDLDRKNPYLVERSLPVDFLAAKGDEQFERETSKVAAHGNYFRTRYRTLKATFAPAFRRVGYVDAKTAETARAMQRQRAERVTKEREIKAARKSYSKLGMSTPRDLRPGQAEAAKELVSIMGKGPLSTDANGETVYHLKEAGTEKTSYVNYLLTRLTEFRKIGASSFGQQFNKPITFGITRSIVESHLKGKVYDESRFDEVCEYLKEAIDKTIQGKNNAAKGHPNYHAFENHKEKAAKT